MLSFVRWFVRVCFLAMLFLLPACASSCSSTIEPKQSPQDTLFLFDTRATYALTRVLPSSVHKSGDLTPQPPLQLRFASWRGGAGTAPQYPRDRIGSKKELLAPPLHEALRSNAELERGLGGEVPRRRDSRCQV